MAFVCDHHLAGDPGADARLPYCLLRPDANATAAGAPPWLALFAPFDLAGFGRERLVIEVRRAPRFARVRTLRWSEAAVRADGGRVTYRFRGRDALVLQLLVAELEALGYDASGPAGAGP
jgi:hypothetical protein